MDSDKLGQKGQHRFGEICADADLCCNPSTYDRTGWDFIVEFPFENAGAEPQPLDSRKTPISCHVQVKTILEQTDFIKLRLTAAERLAKELKPAFIYVFKVNAALQFIGARLIHVLDDSLARILKRLRSEQAVGETAPNRKYLTFSANEDGVPLDPTGDALRTAVLSLTGPDLHAYTSRKAEQLAKLGFEQRPYAARMNLKCTSMDDLVDLFLGLKGGVSVSSISTEETRFGIKLPLRNGPEGAGRISI